MDGKNIFRKRKIIVILKALSVFIFVYMVYFIKLSFSVPQSHFIRFMFGGFFICLFVSVLVFALIVSRIHRGIEEEKHYDNLRQQKLTMSNGMCECQSCGNRRVVSADRNCGICGITFDAAPERNKTEQTIPQ